MSSVVPIPKTATSTYNPSNYRPISLLSVASTFLENHIHTIVFEQLAAQGSFNSWAFAVSTLH